MPQVSLFFFAITATLLSYLYLYKKWFTQYILQINSVRLTFIILEKIGKNWTAHEASRDSFVHCEWKMQRVLTCLWSYTVSILHLCLLRLIIPWQWLTNLEVHECLLLFLVRSMDLFMKLCYLIHVCNCNTFISDCTVLGFLGLQGCQLQAAVPKSRELPI